MSEWKQEEDGTWWRRVLPNPLGLQLEVGPLKSHWMWTVYATTPDHVESIAYGRADTLEAAKMAADTRAKEELTRLAGRLGEALGMLFVPEVIAQRDAALAMLRPVQDAIIAHDAWWEKSTGAPPADDGGDRPLANLFRAARAAVPK